MTNLTAETRRRGERSGDRVIARDLHPAKPKSGSAGTPVDRVIGKAACICHPEQAGANATASRRIPTFPVPKHVASGSSHETLKDLLARLASAIQTLRAVLREIFDESAYERFLLRTNGVHNLTSYRDFMQERDAAMAEKPRCC